MYERALSYLLDNAGAGGCVTESCPAGWVVYQPHIDWPIFSWALTAPQNITSNSAQTAVEELVLSLRARQRKPSLLIPSLWEKLMQPTLEEMHLSPHELHHVLMTDNPELSPTPPEQDVLVVRAKDPAAWLELLLDGFEVPVAGRLPFRHANAHILAGDSRAFLYEAMIDGQRAGAALLWVENGVAGLNTATVRPEFRRRGIYKALAAARIQQGRILNLSSFAVETAQPAVERVAIQCGFSKVLSYRLWF